MYDWSQLFIKGENMGQTFKIGERSKRSLNRRALSIWLKKIQTARRGLGEGQEVEGNWAMESPLLA
jgi:hypothetical protein